VHSVRTLGWRLVNCFGFAATTVFLLLPSLLALQGSPEAGNTYQMRFVASGATFCVALGLALAAQFALRKSAKSEATTRVAAAQT
jgi:hypothetical protein